MAPPKKKSPSLKGKKTSAKFESVASASSRVGEVSASSRNTRASSARPKAPFQGAMSFEEQVKAQMQQLKEQQQQAEEMREGDKLKQKQSLKEKLKMRSENKKQRVVSANRSRPSKKISTVQDKPTWDEAQTVSNAPKPTVPVTKKETLYTEENIALFNDLESFAIDKAIVPTSDLIFSTLMEKLLIEQLSDLEKVRMLFHWITAQDLNSLDFSGKILSDSPLEYFKGIKEETKTYAAMFARLCAAAGIHAKVITGYLKGAGYFPDYHFGDQTDPFRGSWNAVLLEDQWRLVDTNWGSRHVTEEGEATTSDAGQPEYKYEEHYFLTDPDLMINTHFPDDKEWQLLNPPLTIQQFQNLPKMWPLFHKLKLELYSHKDGVITTDEGGYVKVQLKVSPFARTDAKLRAELRQRSKVGSATTDFPQHLFHYTDVELETFEVFLPEPGKYLLKIYALSNKYNEKNIYTNACLFQLNCSSIKRSAEHYKIYPPFPVISLFYGASVINSQIIAEPVSHIGPIIQCNEKGEARLTMEIKSEDRRIAFAHDLFGASASRKALPHRVVQSFEKTSTAVQVTFYIRTPSKGNFALALYSNHENTATGTFHPFCYYLVHSSVQREILSDFPDVPNEVVGGLYPRFYDLSLNVRICYPQNDWKTGMLQADDSGECIIVFEHTHPITMLVDFTCQSVSENLNQYTSVESTGLLTCVVARTPTKLTGNKSFLLRVYAAEAAESQNVPSVYVAFIFSSFDNITQEPIPQSPTRSWGPSGLYFSKSGVTWMAFEESSWAFKSKCNLSQFLTCGPHRVYEGGSDFEIEIKSLSPLQLKAKLQELNPKQEAQDLENFSFLGQADTKSAVVRVRLIRTGYFSLVLYGCKMDSASGQLAPLAYILIYVKKPSNTILPFPTAFGAWASSARFLYSPQVLEIERNKEVIVKAHLAQFIKGEKDSWKEIAYPSVLFVVDGTQPVEPKSSKDNTFEWKYLPGPSEKLAGILVRTDKSSQSMTYAVQFQIR